MPVSLAILAGLIVLAVIFGGRWAAIWLKFRGARVITCPENRTPAGVRVDARHAAATALGKAPKLRLAACSRWPERASCGQECLSQISAAPEDCLVRNILVRWYHGKNCASCGRPFGDLDWSGAKPAILRPDGTSVEWSAIPADHLYEVLAASLPLCFACHMAKTLVRERPELVVDRSSSHS
jgi:hypothetical protein